jgi:hypothetical protein
MADIESGGWRLVTYVWQYDANRANPYQAKLTRRTPGDFMAGLYRVAADNHQEYPRLPAPTPHLVCCREVSDAEAAALEAAGVSVLVLSDAADG